MQRQRALRGSCKPKQCCSVPHVQNQSAHVGVRPATLLQPSKVGPSRRAVRAAAAAAAEKGKHRPCAGEIAACECDNRVRAQLSS